MNPSDAFLYPASYYRDMAFFVAKFMTHIFEASDIDGYVSTSCSPSMTWNSEVPFELRKSDTPVITAAIDGHFATEWESQLYQVIHRVFQRSMLDDSVAIGTVVLLDLLGDLYKMGQYIEGEQSQCILPTYPDEAYVRYFKGAYMLAFRLLSGNKPVQAGYWERILGEDDVGVSNIENDFRIILEQNINCYPPLPILADDPTYHFYYAGSLTIPPNVFIHRLKYLRSKATMYAHIRILMTSRGEDVAVIEPSTKGRKKDLALHFPPCDYYMTETFLRFDEVRRLDPRLRAATNEQVHEYLKAWGKAQNKKEKPLVGLGISF